ncbi:hypothetical protein HXA34_06990 [Salipaludibacillus agaradhaerens]|jgi:bacterioferritin (cytochrome b1)|uniref:hypothetical protein n=1 Tax=Salipaludibacillus agaradhaerens TaxID=76935 RepID=UPI002150A6CF|nr:hypothetical protein [Salipaludibacillus agaradhaerens]MCR6106022.1 hypothetical protein [Salipaludibacillus agaradhaerens]MCR6118055.1 hypothetical protein [Salipaludibacillus agaradhaerens]UJW57193.1 hypothetical protein HXZ66_07140 [Bacillus sp. A116_S68]
MILYDFLLVTIGIFIGVIAGDPLKKLFTGQYKEEIRQKKRVKLLLYLREEAEGGKVSTRELCETVFRGKEHIDTVHKLLEDIEETGLIKSVSTTANVEEKKWAFNKHKDRQR